jgi:NADH-quinone oxidoreductase subunit H
MDWTFWLEWFVKAFIMSMVILTGFAYLTLYERRALARIQTRIGPNRAGPQGLLQPIADAVKLIFKEELTPAGADKLIFVIAPIVTVVPAMVLAAVIPLGTQFTLPFTDRVIHLYVADVNVGVLYLTAIASISVYGIVLAGWSSDNKYALLGGMRSTAQMISYELALGLCFVISILLGNSMSLVDIVTAQKNMWFAVLQPVGALVFMITTLAEVNRAPFDMPEAEQELAAGYHSEYSGMKFALFFMAEYSKMIVICMIAATLFFGGYREFWFLRDTFLSVDAIWHIGAWTLPAWFLGPLYLLLKVIVLLFFMIWVRATWPRIRYDRLMSFGWKVLLPLAILLVVVTAAGILLADQFGPLWQWSIPILSLIVGGVVLLLLNQALRSKVRKVAHA